jgi:RHS repeat-associated protein
MALAAAALCAPQQTQAYNKRPGTAVLLALSLATAAVATAAPPSEARTPDPDNRSITTASGQSAHANLFITSIKDQLFKSHFGGPLVPTKPTTAKEDRELLRAVRAQELLHNEDDYRPIEQFLSAQPHSGWRASVQLNLGIALLNVGHYARAIDAFEGAWRDGKAAKGVDAKAVADAAVGQLALLHARLGHRDRVTSLLDEIKDRPITGSATTWVDNAQQTLWVMRNDPRHLYLCGPQALKALMLQAGATSDDVRFLDRYRADSPKGVNLTDVANLAEQARLPLQPVFRKPGEKVPVPSVVHLKVGHFAAIIAEAGGNYVLKDPVLSPNASSLVSKNAIDEEASGYFLARVDEKKPAPWRKVASREANQVWGSGPTSGLIQGDAGDPLASGCSGNAGMCGTNIKEAAAGLVLSDTPVGYTPPIGPAVPVTLTYNQREDSQPSTMNFSNVSPKWTMNWTRYVQDDPVRVVQGVSVSRNLPGGGAYYYSLSPNRNHPTFSFPSETDDDSVLTLVSITPIVYQRAHKDGTLETYSQSDGATTFPRRVFLTQIVDPQGNSLHLNYDTQKRLSSITDATNRQPLSPTEVRPRHFSSPAITDPFGRSANLTYDASKRLASITDTIGLTSVFSYDASSAVNSMTTPYGTTQIATGSTNTSVYVNSRWVTITDPLGNTEREEFVQPAPAAYSDPLATVPKGLATYNAYLEYRDSYHWDPHQYVAAGCAPAGTCNYAMARTTHFVHAPFSDLEGTAIESRKTPLENRVWFNYPNQSSSPYAGTSQQPTAIARVLDDGTTQLEKRAYNALGNPAQFVDPAGRTTNLTYAANQIDLTSVTQTTGTTQTTIAQMTYNAQHRPVTVSDAAGQTTNLGYNPTGQLTSVTNPAGEITNFKYDGLGYLAAVIDANGVTAASFTRDAAGRVATSTDSEGRTLGYSYDNADRVTQIAYTDGTTEQFSYDKLDLAAYRDRQGHVWSYGHDANRRLTSVIDPAGNQTDFTYYENGALKSMTDPNRHTTTWDIDLQGRTTAKRYADATSELYAYEQTTSRLKAITDALGQVKQFKYAADDRPASISYANVLTPTPGVTFTWDAAFPRLASMTDGTGPTQFSYVPPGSLGALKLQQEIGPNGSVAYAYDELGRLRARNVNGVMETTEYDRIGRPVLHSNALGQFATTWLGETSQMTSRQLVGSTIGTTWGYLDSAHDRRLASISNAGLRTYQYTTTPENMITGIAEQTCSGAQCMPSASWSMTYDNAYRLTSAGAAGALSPYSYTLDPAGNITQFQPGNKGAAYNTVNQLLNLAGQPYSSDTNGSLLNDGQRLYTWDAEKRLVGIDYSGLPNKHTRITYDGLGRRTAITTTTGSTSVTTNYQWCGEQICQARDAATNTLQHAYYPEGELLANGTKLFTGPDQIGSVREAFAVSALSTTPQAYDYEPYGNPTQAPSDARQPDFRYAGLFYHQDSGLYLANYRAYDPRSARWLSRDPIGEDGGLNLYTYADVNPLSNIDPDGTDPQMMSRPIGLTGSWLTPSQERAILNNSTLKYIADNPQVGYYLIGSSAILIPGGLAADACLVERGAIFGTRYLGNLPWANRWTALRMGWSKYGQGYTFRIGGKLVEQIRPQDPHITLWPTRMWPIPWNKPPPPPTP